MFLKKNGVYVGLPTCIERFDEFAADFMTVETDPERKKIVSNADAESSKITDKLKRVR